MMCDSVISFSALLSMPRSNSITVTTYDNLANAFYGFWHLFKHYVTKGQSCRDFFCFLLNTPNF